MALYWLIALNLFLMRLPIRFIDVIWRNIRGTPVSGELYNWEFTRNKFYQCGDSSGEHCFYIEGENIIIEGSEMVHPRGYCVQFYASDAVPVKSITLRRNLCRDGVVPEFNVHGAGIGGGFTLRGNTFNRVHNNIFARTSVGVDLFGGTSGQANGEEIFNNTFVDVSGPSAISMGGQAGNSTNFQLRNNIFYNVGSLLNNLSPPDSTGAPSNVPIESNNLCFNVTSGSCTGPGSINGLNPNLVDVNGNDFRLCKPLLPTKGGSGCGGLSPAIDKGFDLFPYVTQSFDVTTSYDGTTRPWRFSWARMFGDRWDIGAYEAGRRFFSFERVLTLVFLATVVFFAGWAYGRKFARSRK